MKRVFLIVVAGAALFAAVAVVAGTDGSSTAPFGLPPVPIPEDNPQTPAKIALGDKLYNETRFSTDGEVGCFTCHMPEKAFTDSPLKVSQGIEKKTGTRNAPTVINSAYFTSQFWDGRSPDLEDQSLQPFINPVEHGLADHEPILEIVRTDPEYVAAFDEVFGKTGKDITMREVSLAIAAFERTIVSGNSPFDRWFYAGESDALTEQQKRGYDLFVNQGR
ncbi:MAG: cytochrome-c peroxidase, partial [Thermoanaerobaculales bacterium]|nr:cytochrome-c peroxidase [Thermoanaerobaculales bacterium]